MAFERNSPAHRLSAQKTVDPEVWRARVMLVLSTTHGNVERACEVLGVGARTLHRWCAQDEQLKAFLAAARNERKATS